MGPRIIIVLAVLASAAAVFTATASAYTWKPSEKWAFIDNHVEDFEITYKWPNLYAECLQKSAAKSFRSYPAYLNAPDRAFMRWARSDATMHCMLVYGKKWYD